MSVIIKYVGLELRNAVLFSRVAERGFVMQADREEVKDIFVAYMENTRKLWETQLPQRAVSFFDAHTLVQNPRVRHDMALSFIHSQWLEEQDTAPEDAQFHTTLETFSRGARDTSNGLMELAGNDDFVDILMACDLDLAQKLLAYAEDREAKARDASAEPLKIPELDQEAAYYSELMRAHLDSLLRKDVLPRPVL